MWRRSLEKICRAINVLRGGTYSNGVRISVFCSRSFIVKLEGLQGMRVHSPSSRSGSRIYLSLWDLFWALVSPLLALYLRGVDPHFDADWSAVVYYWVLSGGFAILAFFAFRLQDGMTRYFSVHEALDIAEAVLFAELMTFAVLFTLTRLDGIPRSI